jgi:hypothetical protein
MWQKDVRVRSADGSWCTRAARTVVRDRSSIREDSLIRPPPVRMVDRRKEIEMVSDRVDFEDCRCSIRRQRKIRIPSNAIRKAKSRPMHRRCHSNGNLIEGDVAKTKFEIIQKSSGSP